MINIDFKEFKLSTVILFLGLLILTLVSYTIYEWAVGLFLVILFLIIEQISIEEKPFIVSLFLLFLLILATIRFKFFLISEVLPLYSHAFLGNLSKFIMCIIVWLVIRSLILSGKGKYLFNLIAPILWFHIGAFYLQFFVYLISGYYIDFVKPVTNVASRYISFTNSLAGIGSFRPTGMLVEPSTYFMVVLTLASLLLIHKGFKKHKVLFVLTIISMYLSYSTAAVIIATIFVFYLFYTQRIKVRYYVVMGFFAVLVFYIGATKIGNLYEAQVTKFSNSSGSRVNLVTTVINRNIDESFLAYGPFALGNSIAKSSTTKLGNRTVSSTADAGLFVYMWVKFGYLGIFLFLLLCFWQYRSGRHRLPLFLILSLSKVPLFSPFFVLFFAVSISMSELDDEFIPSKAQELAKTF